MLKCRLCERELKNGDDVFELDVKVIETENDETKVRMVRKYECAPKCPR